MVSNCDKWVRIFDIPDTSRHKKGFTIYKVISMLYPEECPDAVTKITVWKRYNEFKRLHRELRVKHRTLGIKSRFPALPNDLFFKRFNEDVIKERKQCILILLDYVAKQPQLFTSDEFVKFFETSHTPTQLINGSINSIRAELHLPAEPEYHVISNSDDDYALSDTDSVSTLSSLSPSAQAFDLLSDPLNQSSLSLNRLSKKMSPESSLTLSQTSENTSTDSVNVSVINESVPTIDDLKFPHNSLSNALSSNQYIVEAAHYVTKATEMELEKKYNDAFIAYKAGIDILLKNAKEDGDFNRREMVRFKVEKYLLRAEKIYNLHLSPEIQNINELAYHKEDKLQKPLVDLYKYKVVKVIGSGMLVIHSESQQLFYVKVVYKTWNFSDYLILPENVPYMVKLVNFYNCENALFLILEYCCGVRILDYLKQQNEVDDNSKTTDFTSSHKKKSESSDDSECSYGDLIHEYTINKKQNEAAENEKECDAKSEIELSMGYAVDDTMENTFEENDSLETEDLVMKSQKLITSIESTLKQKNDTPKRSGPSLITKENVDKYKLIERQLSSVSLLSDDFKENFVNIRDVVKWAAQLLLALEKLHILGVICCDIKCKNLLIDQNGDLMLTYMCSLSKENSSKNRFQTSLAPELNTFEKVTFAVDWWCYGTILYELLVGVPLKYVHPEGINNYTNLKIAKFVIPEGKSLLRQLLIYEPQDRLGCGINGTEDIKTHPFFNAISWESLASKYNEKC